jgi:hypothetical protein
MPQLDGLKEQLAYLRLWLGILMVAEVSLMAWIASAPETTTPRLFAIGVGGIIGLGIGVYLLHQQIKRCIEEVRSL